MSTDNPFSHRHPYQQPVASPPPSSGSRWLLFSVIFAGVGLAFCCGLGTLTYFALQRAAGLSAEAKLPQRGDSRAADQARFNQSLANVSRDPTADPCIDIEVCEFVQLSLDALREGDEIPFSTEMFIEAVAASKLSQGSLGIIDRISIKTWIVEYAPAPNCNEENERILDVRLDETEKFATVDLLLYADESQALSQQWYLVREDNQWKMYDWQRMEYGRRMSDEYAGYVRGEPPQSDGYDIAMDRLFDAEELWYDGNEKEARKKLLACESIPMLESDRVVAQLRTAYTWMTLDQYDETIRVLESIDNPDAIWGVWPVLAVCYFHEGDEEKALEIALRAKKQSPDHPNVQSLLSAIYDSLGRENESADAAVASLRICPEDTAEFNDVVSNGRPEDIPVLLDVLTVIENEWGWSRVLSQAAGSTEWAQWLMEQISARDDMPSGAMELAAGNLAWSQEDYDTAATHFLKAVATARLPFLKEIATRDHVSSRLEEERLVELFRESEDPEATAAMLAQWAYEDEIYCDPERLLEALQQTPATAENDWFIGLSGWAHHSLGQHEAAMADFDTFLGWLKSDSAALDDSQQWIIGSVEYYLTQSMLESGRPLDVVTRWPDDVDRLEQLGDHLLEQHHAGLTGDFLNATSETTSDALRLQRLRLQSAAAMRAGDAKQSDLLQSEAIELGSDVYDEDHSYLIHGLIRRRARNLVWNQLSDVLIDSAESEDGESSGRDQLILGAVTEANRIVDGPSLAAWMQRADEAGIHDGTTYTSLQYSLGQYCFSQGDFAGAIDALRESLRMDGSENHWYDDRGRHLLILAMLKAGRSEELRNWLAENTGNESDETGVPSDAVFELATGDIESLRASFSGIEKSDVAEWLADSFQRDFLQRHADEPWVTELIKQYRLPVQYHRTEAAGTLLLASDEKLDQRLIEKSLAESLGEPFQSMPLAGHARSGDSAAWIATSKSGQRILVSWSKQAYETDQMPEPLSKSFETPVCRLTIEILDHEPHATKRLFLFAAALADSDAIAFSSESYVQVWTSPNLKQQLQWHDRVPFTPKVRFISLVVGVDSDEDANESRFLSIDEWAEMYEEASGNPLAITVTQSTGLSGEQIPCDLLGVDVDDYSLLIRPKVDSQIDPLLRAGIQYTCRPGNVSMQAVE